MRRKLLTWLRDWASACVGDGAPGPEIAAAAEETAPEVAPKRRAEPFSRRRSASQVAADWESARDPEFQREARALIAERAAARKRREKKHGNDHKKR